jgi:hypothetical protein
VSLCVIVSSCCPFNEQHEDTKTQRSRKTGFWLWLGRSVFIRVRQAIGIFVIRHFSSWIILPCHRQVTSYGSGSFGVDAALAI